MSLLYFHFPLLNMNSPFGDSELIRTLNWPHSRCTTFSASANKSSVAGMAPPSSTCLWYCDLSQILHQLLFASRTPQGIFPFLSVAKKIPLEMLRELFSSMAIVSSIFWRWKWKQGVFASVVLTSCQSSPWCCFWCALPLVCLFGLNLSQIAFKVNGLGSRDESLEVLGCPCRWMNTLAMRGLCLWVGK